MVAGQTQGSLIRLLMGLLLLCTRATGVAHSVAYERHLYLAYEHLYEKGPVVMYCNCTVTAGTFHSTQEEYWGQVTKIGSIDFEHNETHRLFLLNDVKCVQTYSICTKAYRMSIYLAYLYK